MKFISSDILQELLVKVERQILHQKSTLLLNDLRKDKLAMSEEQCIPPSNKKYIRI